VSVLDFYDGLAPDYHLVYAGRWDEAIASQAEVLDTIIRSAHPDARDVLDCSCGIGTQAIGLAKRGYRVHGTDISARSIDRARDESRRLGARLTLEVADFRDLSSVEGDYDVVLSADNALPHLLDDADLTQALHAMRAKLRPDGLLVISIRDYDKALVDRPATAPPFLIEGPPRRLVVRLHDWDAPDSPLYTVRFFILTETQAGDWTLAHHATRYRAITRDALSHIARDAGFDHTAWFSPEGFHQPVMTARPSAAPRRPSAHDPAGRP
jgi:glycine/sarcosine N-methyltransferase